MAPTPGLLVSPEDEDLLALTWYPDPLHKYVYRKYTVGHRPDGKRIQKSEYMHRLILERKIGRPLERREYTDHINGNQVDNRRENLRVASPRQNVMNQRRRIDNKSGAKGVFWYERYKAFEVYIKFEGKRHYLGRYAEFDEAVSIRETAELKFFGEYSVLLSRPNEAQHC